MELYFVGQYVDTKDGMPKLTKKLYSNLSEEAAEAIAHERNLASGHREMPDGVLINKPGVPYFMYDLES
jgi:hypothetical protein